MPTRSSSTLWLMPTEISMNLARYVHARHLPSENSNVENQKTLKVNPSKDPPSAPMGSLAGPSYQDYSTVNWNTETLLIAASLCIFHCSVVELSQYTRRLFNRAQDFFQLYKGRLIGGRPSGRRPLRHEVSGRLSESHN